MQCPRTRSDGGPIRVVITDRLTAVSGTVTDEQGRPITDCDVLVFAADAARWQSGARSIRKVRPDQNGAYRAEALAPGRYHVLALRRLAEDSMSDPAVLSSLRPLSESVELSAGNPQQRNLRVTEGAR